MAEIHNRMPAIISPHDEAEWLSREKDNNKDPKKFLNKRFRRCECDLLDD